MLAKVVKQKPPYLADVKPSTQEFLMSDQLGLNVRTLNTAGLSAAVSAIFRIVLPWC